MQLVLRLFGAAVLFWLGVATSWAEVTYEEVVVTGMGRDLPEATRDAIEEAIGQVTGKRVSSETSLAMSQGVRGETVTVTEDFKKNIQTLTKGAVKSYQVLESGSSKEGPGFQVTIKAVIPVYRASEQLKRRRLAVVPVSLASAVSTNPDARKFAEAVSAATEAYLVQTRKFAMLDQKHIAEIDEELSKLSKKSVAIEELARVASRAAADYLVLLTLTSFQKEEKQVTRLTGRQVETLRIPLAIDIRVIDLATTQIKFGQSYAHPGRLPARYSLTQFSADVGQDIGQMISSAIYPIAVIDVSGAQLTFNQGGETVKVGQLYRVVKLGDPLTDPHTGESLGRAEQEIARAEVVSVTDRTATATLLSGTIQSGFEAGSLSAHVLVGEGPPRRPDAGSKIQSDQREESLSGADSSKPSKSKRSDEEW